jgi:hypothetical protein
MEWQVVEGLTMRTGQRVRWEEQAIPINHAPCSSGPDGIDSRIWSRSTMHQPAENTAMIIKMTGRSPPPITTVVKQVSLSNSATSGDPSFQILL